ncbi:MAG: hypothetical protein ACFB21_14290 [Opitutales bacterium]
MGKDTIGVLDGLPPRIKTYTKEGKYLGEHTQINWKGESYPFFDLISIEQANDAWYLLAWLRGFDEKAVLMKLSSLEGDLQPIWAISLDRKARFIAVDENHSPTLVYVGNGAGDATYSQIEDRGTQTGTVRHIGGIEPKTLVDPRILEAAGDGTLLIHDYGRHKIIAVDENGENWREVEAERENPVYHFTDLHRRFMYYLDDNARYNEGTPNTMAADNLNERLLVTYDRIHGSTFEARKQRELDMPLQKTRGYDSFDFDLNRQAFDVELASGNWDEKWKSEGLAERWPWSPYAVEQGWQEVGPDGKIYEYPVHWPRTGPHHKEYGDHLLGRIQARDDKGDYIRDDDSRVKDFVHTAGFTGNITTDSKGNIYVIDTKKLTREWYGELTFSFPNFPIYWKGEPQSEDTWFWYRNGKRVISWNEFSYVVKFGLDGGDRFTDQEWAVRGGGIQQACNCNAPANLLDCDGSDRIIVGDVTNCSINILDTAGNLINRFGTYGNAEIQPPKDGDAKALGFRDIYSLTATKDSVYVSDRSLMRVARVKLGYRETVTVQP